MNILFCKEECQKYIKPVLCVLYFLLLITAGGISASGGAAGAGVATGTGGVSGKTSAMETIKKLIVL